MFLLGSTNTHKPTNKQTTEINMEYLVHRDVYFKTLTRKIGGRAV